MFFRESTVEHQQEKEHPPLTRSTLSATAPEYNGKILSKSDLSPPLPEDKQDIILFDSSDECDHQEAERYLTQEIGYSIKLLIAKTIYSEHKNSKKYFLIQFYLNLNYYFLLVLIRKQNLFIIIVQQKISMIYFNYFVVKTKTDN